MRAERVPNVFFHPHLRDYHTNIVGDADVTRLVLHYINPFALQGSLADLPTLINGRRTTLSPSILTYDKNLPRDKRPVARISSSVYTYKPFRYFYHAFENVCKPSRYFCGTIPRNLIIRSINKFGNGWEMGVTTTTWCRSGASLAIVSSRWHTGPGRVMGPLHEVNLLVYRCSLEAYGFVGLVGLMYRGRTTHPTYT